jgi:methanogenic corrinoid protein MtbC1
MNSIPNIDRVSEQLFSYLVGGERRAARELVDALYNAGIAPETVSKDLFWPLLECISTMFRKDQITTLSHHYATRMLRMLVDQAQARYTMAPSRNRRIALFCGPNETEELAGQMVADLLESDGYEITFAGGGVANEAGAAAALIVRRGWASTGEALANVGELQALLETLGQPLTWE